MYNPRRADKRQYLEDCWKRAQRHWAVAIIAALVFLYSAITNWAPVVILPKWAEPDKWLRLPLAWALVVVLACFGIIVFTGGYLLSEELKTNPAASPDVVVEYSYSEEKTFREQFPPDASAPIVLVNTSEQVAKNVRVLPMTVGELVAAWENATANLVGDYVPSERGRIPIVALQLNRAKKSPFKPQRTIDSSIRHT